MSAADYDSAESDNEVSVDELQAKYGIKPAPSSRPDDLLLGKFIHGGGAVLLQTLIT